MFGRFRQLLIDTENVFIIMILIGVGLGISLGVPQLSPTLQRGAICTNLPHPRGGNSQSLLALSGDDHQDIELNIEVVHEAENERGDPLIPLGEPLILRVTFQNEDIGPVTLYFRSSDFAIGSFDTLEAQNVMGVMFEINPIDIRSPVTRPNQFIQQQLNTFELDNLYMLQAESRCYMEYRISDETLRSMGMTSREWRIRAYYRNRQPGVLVMPTPKGDEPTPTPMFDDQGVWTGSVGSNEVIFEIR